MSILTPGGLPSTDRIGNIIQPSYRNMIRLETLMDDPDFNSREKTLLGLGLLYGPSLPSDLSEALKELQWFYACGKEDEGNGSRRNTPRLYDFEEDAECIYSGFMAAYQINLTTTDLHWWEFMSLFVHLPENTLMAQKIYYRNVDTSQMKGEQRKMCELRKKAYSLKKKIAVKETLQELEAKHLDYVNRRFAEAEKRMKGG